MNIKHKRTNKQHLMENNIFTPGLPGYGIKGSPGGDGTYGSSIYISVLSFNTQLPDIKNKIIANKKLISKDETNFRDYIVGDSFIDINGDMYTLIHVDRNLTTPIVEFTFAYNVNASDYIRKYTNEMLFEGSKDRKYVRVANDFAKGYTIDNITKTQNIDEPISLDALYTSVGGSKIPLTSFSHINYSDHNQSNVEDSYEVFNQIWCNGKVGMSLITSSKAITLSGLRLDSVESSSKDVDMRLDFRDVRVNRGKIPIDEYVDDSVVLVRDIDCPRLYKSFFRYGIDQGVSINDRLPQCVTSIIYDASTLNIKLEYNISDVYASNTTTGSSNEFKDVKFKCFKRVSAELISQDNVYTIDMFQGNFNKGCVVNLPSPTGSINLMNDMRDDTKTGATDELVCCFLFNDNGWERTSTPFLMSGKGAVIKLDISKQ